ncbi:hypothetical protein AAC387_Pa07g3295 [Persea americana]
MAATIMDHCRATRFLSEAPAPAPTTAVTGTVETTQMPTEMPAIPNIQFNMPNMAFPPMPDLKFPSMKLPEFDFLSFHIPSIDLASLFSSSDSDQP